MKNEYYFMDFEASSLDYERSFPIEIAWGNAEVSIKNFIIKPVYYWTYWSNKSEKIHGLSKEYIRKNGTVPLEICEQLKELEGKTVLSDAAEWDQMWLDKLMVAGKVKLDIKLVDIFSVIEELWAEIPKKTQQSIRIIKSRIQQSMGKRHRAENDVQYLIKFLDAAVDIKNNFDRKQRRNHNYRVYKIIKSLSKDP